MAGFLTPLELEYIDGHIWELTAPFEYCVGSKDSNVKVIIPKGFITDFASVPKILWNLLPPTGSYGKAAVVHDYLYQHPWVTIYDVPAQPTWFRTELKIRKECDEILNEAMQVLNVGKWTRRMVYTGVRVGGWKPWNSYREKEI